MSKDQWDSLVKFAALQVQSVEQLQITKQIIGDGQTKKNLALSGIADFAEKLGIPVTEPELEALVESSIRQGAEKGWEEWAAPLKVPSDTSEAK